MAGTKVVLRTQTRCLRRLMRDLFDAGLEYLLENLRDTRYGDRHDVFWCGTSLTLRPPLDSQPDLWHLTAKYGARHGIWAPGALTRTCPGTCRPEEAGLGPVALLQGETQQSRRL